MGKGVKSIAYEGRLYYFAFPIYFCQHFHGWFRWLGGSKGHYRFEIPKDLGLAKSSSAAPQLKSDIADDELVRRVCANGHKWEEFDVSDSQRTSQCPWCKEELSV
jgi:hypothetical protein